MNPLEHIPSTLLRPLPANATSDAKLRDKIDSLGRKLPGSLGQMLVKTPPETSFSRFLHESCFIR